MIKVSKISWKESKYNKILQKEFRGETKIEALLKYINQH